MQNSEVIYARNAYFNFSLLNNPNLYYLKLGGASIVGAIQNYNNIFNSYYRKFEGAVREQKVGFCIIPNFGTWNSNSGRTAHQLLHNAIDKFAYWHVRVFHAALIVAKLSSKIKLYPRQIVLHNPLYIQDIRSFLNNPNPRSNNVTANIYDISGY